MITAWTKHLKDPQEIERFKNSFLGSKMVLERLKALLEEEEAGLDRFELDPKSYDTSNWAYKQAHTNGFRASLKMINKLINLDQGNKE